MNQWRERGLKYRKKFYKIVECGHVTILNISLNETSIEKRDLWSKVPEEMGEDWVWNWR